MIGESKMLDVNNISSNIIFKDHRYSIAHTGDISFNDTLKKCIETQNTTVENRIENLFENMDVTVKVGECNVSKQTWESDYFPFWNYFNKSSEANVLNDWKNNKIGTGTDLQKYLQSIGFGEMVVIIPENIKNRMLEDEEFAENIIQKLDTWKKNYDLKDNAVAAMNGLNTSIYQMSKSYCITIDEEGEIGNYAVVSGGLDDSNSAINNNFSTNDDGKSYLKQILNKGNDDGKRINASQLVEKIYTDPLEFDFSNSIDAIASAFIKKRRD